MNGLAELITVAKYWREWDDPRFYVMVLNNRDLNQVTWELRAMAGEPRVPTTQDIPDVAYAQWAELIGLKGIRVDHPDQVAGAWSEALAADRPVVIEAITDPEVPPLPPHITIEQAQSFTYSLLRGDPHTGRMIAQSAKQKLEEFLPGR